MSKKVKTLRMLEDYYPAAKGIADHLEAVEAALSASTELVRLQDELLACYRAGRRPRVETLDRIGGLKVRIAANEAALGGVK